MKSSKKRILLFAITALFAVLSGIVMYADMASSSVVPVLMYHSIGVPEIPGTPFISQEAFAMQMEFLAKNRYNVVGPDECVAYMLKKKKMPPRTVVITADDGFYDFYEYAFPVLKKYNLKATVFVTTDKIGESGRLDWKELREMSDSGLVTIASHTKSHPWLPGVSVDAKKLDDEIVVSKDVLEKGIGRGIDYISYPNGAFNDVIREAAMSAGYKGAFTTNPVRCSDINDIYAIRRIKMSSSSRSPLILWGKISRYYVWFKERR